MPSPPCTLCVPEYIQELDKFPSLRQNGFSFLVDASSKLFTSVRPSLKDVETNIEAGRFCAPACLHVSLHSFILILSSWPLEAVEGIMRATRGRGRFSSHLLKIVIIQYYEKHKLLPKGMVSSMDCVQTWALKMGLALQRLASWQQSLHYVHESLSSCRAFILHLSLSKTILLPS